MKTLYLDIHAIRTLGQNSSNRGSMGEVKTVTYNGSTRQYLSSQSRKASIREYMKTQGFETATRTKELKKIILDGDTSEEMNVRYNIMLDYIAKFSPDVSLSFENSELDEWKQILRNEDLPWDLIKDCFKIKGIDVTRKDKKSFPKSKKHKEADNLFTELINKRFPNSVDKILFGAMYAGDKSSSVDAVSQVANAFSVNSIVREYDYFSAMDDYKVANKLSGASMLGESEFTTSTMYEYENLNIVALYNEVISNIKLGQIEDISNSELKSLAIDKVSSIVKSFAKACFVTTSRGKENSFATRKYPSTYIMELREMPVNAEEAFSEIISGDECYAKQAADRLDIWMTKMDKMLGKPEQHYQAGIYVENTISLNELLDKLESDVREALEVI